MKLMGAAAVAAGFYDSTLGKKAVMAVSGAILFAFIVGHLIGNLQFFEGPEKLNAYGRFLRNMPALLREASWIATLPSMAPFSSAGNAAYAANISAK